MNALVEPTEQVVGGWIAACISAEGWNSKMVCLLGALEDIGDDGVKLMLAKMKMESSTQFLKWLVAK